MRITWRIVGSRITSVTNVKDYEVDFEFMFTDCDWTTSNTPGVCRIVWNASCCFHSIPYYNVLVICIRVSSTVCVEALWWQRVRGAAVHICIFQSVSFSTIVAGGRCVWLTGAVYNGGGRSVPGLLLKLISVVVIVVRLCKLLALTDFVKTRYVRCFTA